MTNNELLEKLADQISVCSLCPLSKDRTKAVPGEGDTATSVLFVGEGPGKNEDLQGRPFCGAAGKFLDELLKSIKLKRSDVFITNVVKCRPPQNRDPENAEIATCFPYTMKQIEEINPKIIVTLGRHSMKEFIPEKFGPISAIHGKAFRSADHKRYYIAMYHPAVALYNGGMRKTLLNDFKTIQKVLDKIK